MSQAFDLLSGLDFAGELSDLRAAHRREVRRILLGFLCVLDGVDRAAAAPDAALGWQVMQRQLVATFTQLGATLFGQPGELFEPDRHHAIEAHVGEGDDDYITECLARGCTWDGEVLRPAQVIVAQRRPSQKEDAHGQVGRD